MNDKQRALFQKFAALASLLVLTIVFSFVSTSFLSVGNTMTVALQVTSIAYLGIGASGHLGVKTAVEIIQGKKVPKFRDTGVLMVTKKNVDSAEAKNVLY